jgi:S-adenosylmethionine:diacylglycerol 3-amino-3-carboxypropyl transferase
MKPLYNYGISQEDALTECKAMELADHDSLLCIASAGEIPLNLSAIRNLRIKSVDTAPDQLKLCRIKQEAALSCDAVTAASFLGYMEMRASERLTLFHDLISMSLPEEDRHYWKKNQPALANGVINMGRFELFMKKVAGIGRSVVGHKNLYRLFDCNSVEEQQEVFDSKITGLKVSSIFRIAFHPWIYKNRGIDPAGLTHSGARNIGEFFFHRFRNFCCSTPSRENYYLQFTFFNTILFPEALPEFLLPQFHDHFTLGSKSIDYTESSIQNTLLNAETGEFNKVHISNIGDWMTKESMADLFRLLRDKTRPGARIVMRYIHLRHKIPDDVPELFADADQGYDLEIHDRYPFYSIVPIKRI